MMGKSTSDQGISVRNHHPQERITSPRPLTLGSYPSHNLSSFDLPAPLSKRRHLTPAEHELLTPVDSINAYKSNVHPPSIHSELRTSIQNISILPVIQFLIVSMVSIHLNSLCFTSTKNHSVPQKLLRKWSPCWPPLSPHDSHGASLSPQRCPAPYRTSRRFPWAAGGARDPDDKRLEKAGKTSNSSDVHIKK